jgi:predicted nucleic acid-binding protein
MASAVFDTSVLVSAFLTRNQPGGVSSELLRSVAEGNVEPHLSPDIIAETLAALVRNVRAQAPRDPDDDKIVACALAAGAGYIVSRDRGLVPLGLYAGITIIALEPFLRIVRGP